MQVSASITTDYLFKPSRGEMALFRKLLAGKVRPVTGGWTFWSYDTAPEYQIKDRLYLETERNPLGSIATATASFDSKTQSLRALGLGVMANSGEIINVTKGIYSPSFRRIQVDPLGYKFAGIPQTFAIVPNDSDPDRTVVGFSGEYNFNTGLFAGTFDFVTLGDLWSE